MCDGLADKVLPMLKGMVEQSRFLTRVEEPKIVIYCNGYEKAKQRDTWRQYAIKACKKVFDCDEQRVKIMYSDEDAPTMALLRHCNIFHMAGGNAWNIVRDWRSRPGCLQVLQERVQCGEVLYIGSSGGSISAGLDMKYCEDDRSVPGDVDMKGLGIVSDMNVGVHHSNRNNFDNTDDDISVFLGPQTAIFLNGLQCEPAMTAVVKPGVKESLLASPYVVAKLLHRPRQPIPTSSAASYENPDLKIPIQMVLQKGGHFVWDGSSNQRFHVQTQNAFFRQGLPPSLSGCQEAEDMTTLEFPSNKQRQQLPRYMIRPS